MAFRSKINNPIHGGIPRYSPPPIYRSNHLDVPTKPLYITPPPVYKANHARTPITIPYSLPPVYKPKQKGRRKGRPKVSKSPGSLPTYYGLLQSRNHFTYTSPKCLGNNYYNT